MPEGGNAPLGKPSSRGVSQIARDAPAPLLNKRAAACRRGNGAGVNSCERHQLLNLETPRLKAETSGIADPMPLTLTQRVMMC